MKHIINLLVLITIGTGIQSCQKDEAENISFDVTIDRLSYQINDTATFNITGNPNMISFFSGEVGYRYAYRNRVSAEGKPELNFFSALNAGTQINSLKLMVSTDFAGVVVNDTVATAANIAAASWTDMTDRAVLAANNTATASGPIDLTDVASQGKPVYIAFKYEAANGSIQNKWTISNLTVTNTLPDATMYTIANLNASTAAIATNYAAVATFSPGWISTPVKRAENTAYQWVVNSGTSLIMAGAPTIAESVGDLEAWAVMGPLDLHKVTPDVGRSVKAINTVVAPYPYVYTTAGTYKATFIGTNQYGEDANSVIKEFDIAIK